jgi:hypothetical protein
LLLDSFIFRISGRPHFGLTHFCSNLTERAALGYSGDVSLVTSEDCACLEGCSNLVLAKFMDGAGIHELETYFDLRLALSGAVANTGLGIWAPSFSVLLPDIKVGLWLFFLCIFLKYYIRTLLG